MSKLPTDFLVPRMSALTGAATVINLGGGFYSYNISENENQADASAIFSDWSMVGEDLRSAWRKLCKTDKQAEQLELQFED
jgi:hypothetical protein